MTVQDSMGYETICAEFKRSDNLVLREIAKQAEEYRELMTLSDGSDFVAYRGRFSTIVILMRRLYRNGFHK